MEQNNIQKVHFNGTQLIQIETVMIHGVECLRFKDVQRRFPTVNALYIDDRQLAFMSSMKMVMIQNHYVSKHIQMKLIDVIVSRNIFSYRFS